MFSGALTLTDLNDFITPSQACIKPVEEVKPDDLARPPGAAATEIQVDASGAYYEVALNAIPAAKSSAAGAPRRKLEQAQISLNDCLACSGCITSAESVLITLQSHTEVLNELARNPTDMSCVSRKTPVLSVAPQALASLAASLSSSSSGGPPVSPRQVLRRVRAFGKDALGFEHVFDTTFARHLALLEHTREFWERRSAAEGGTGVDVDADADAGGSGSGRLPMLASACPGWVCYAEKTHAEMLPFIARAKSPQQVMGTLVKSWMGERWGKRPDQIYHVTVMPCYDKKLEASRQDFYSEQYATRDVDCVITTGELELLMREKGWDLSRPVPGEDAPLPAPSTASADELALPELLAHPGTSSGSYMHTLLAALQARAPPGTYALATRAVRAPDYADAVLTRTADGAVVFRGATCYGFRNLQNVVRKEGRAAGVQTARGAAGRMAGPARARRVNGARAGAAPGSEERGYDYVEVMACPGGCVNGGGQLKPPAISASTDAEGYARDWAADGVQAPPPPVTADLDPDGVGAQVPGSGAKWGDKAWTKTVEQAYWHDLPTPPPSPSPSPRAPDETSSARADRLAARVLRELCRPAADVEDGAAGWAAPMDEAAEARRRALFRTTYRAVESEVLGIAVKW